jgi:glycosyltransferase involved in cell wall biosynthesis
MERELVDGHGLLILNDQVAEFGGMERMLETVLRRFPAATLVAPRFDRPATGANGSFEARLFQRSALGTGESAWRGELRLVGPDGRRRHYLSPVYARRLRREPLEGATTVLSVGSASWSMAADVPPGIPHIAYVGGPPRALYGHARSYLLEYPLPWRPLIRGAIPALRVHHRRLLRRPDRVLANSCASARGLEPIAGRPVEVLYPPVDTKFFTPAARERRCFVAVSRLRPHKRLDLLVEAFRRLDHELVVAGGGPWLERMRATAPPNVRFVGYLDDVSLRELYRSSRGLVSASVEEFGISVAEAQACGIPAIVPAAGGSREIVINGRTGLLLDELSPDAIADAVGAVAAPHFSTIACRRAGERFGEERFLSGLERALASGAPAGAPLPIRLELPGDGATAARAGR